MSGPSEFIPASGQPTPSTHTWNQNRRGAVTLALIDENEGQIMTYDDEATLEKNKDIDGYSGFKQQPYRPPAEIPDLTKLRGDASAWWNNVSGTKLLVPLLEEFIKTKRRVRDVISIGLSAADMTDKVTARQHTVLNQIVKNLIKLSLKANLLGEKSRPTGKSDEAIGEHIGLTVKYQHHDGPQENGKSEYAEHGLRNELALQLNQRQLDTGVKMEWWKDFSGLSMIREDSMVVILDYRNPWRQILGQYLKESDVEPLVVVCPPRDWNPEAAIWEQFRDRYSKALDEILDDKVYECYTLFDNIRTVGHSSSIPGQTVVVNGPIDFYIRKGLSKRLQKPQDSAKQGMRAPLSHKASVEFFLN